MAWIEVHQALRGHKKTLSVRRELRLETEAQVIGHMVCLWMWALDNEPGGDLSGLDDDEYEFDERLFCVEGHMTGRRIALGDTVKVQVAAVDLGQRRIEFELVRNLPPHRRRRRR